MKLLLIRKAPITVVSTNDVSANNANANNATAVSATNTTAHNEHPHVDSASHLQYNQCACANVVDTEAVAVSDAAAVVVRD
ncbi:MAG: hypothetical protein MHM6MM_004068 [Cercozoa sp. M6MM]